ncbi:MULTISPECIES: MmgE/PrpD family protein [unclassified Aureimonas]|uniref:MmgE/PrpD family protein n=1 Tax=unclassified Aureimonas TaxID=2615206 RepID=UPI0006F42AE5|nr:MULTISPECIES: MmgE/PrpD family protein [unclassified Aureimonas]KQT52490.1 hypothetical protein ASG62_14825 [Aureimonas sp. Leaf427]KQT77609.1 hypothetical protein ASG54_11585 [Aureimonas sp. Leaf460]
MADAIADVARHVVGTRFEDLPAETVATTRRLVLDAIGVGLAGARGQWADELLRCAVGWGGAGPCHVFGRAERLPAPVAALLNACQIHNSEFDSLHEKAVVHALTGTLPAALAAAEVQGGVSGRHLIEAVVVGVDVACAIGLAARSPMTYFRPGVANGFGATAAVGKLLGLDEERLVAAFGACFAQSCGSMQAHEEGSMLLALQIGFNTRNALQACDLAAAGLQSTTNVLEGRFGYFRLFEDASDPAPVVAALGQVRRIDEMSQKPFPCGRATHGPIEALLRLQAHHGFAPEEIETVVLSLTPVAHGLVGRPPRAGMEANYARLCLSYCAARVLVTGGLTMRDFEPEALADEATCRIAATIRLQMLDGAGIDAFAPSSARIELTDGRCLEETVADSLGHPRHPLTPSRHLDKFRGNCARVETLLQVGAADRLIEAVGRLQDVPDVAEIMQLATPPRRGKPRGP